MSKKILSWRDDPAPRPHTDSGWYTTVAIIAIGGSVASIILQNILFSIIIILGAFSLMLAKTQRKLPTQFGLSEKGVHIGEEIILYNRIEAFSISEKDPRTLTLKHGSIFGLTTLRLVGVDFRIIRTELKNRNIEEVDEIHSLVDSIASAIGL